MRFVGIEGADEIQNRSISHVEASDSDGGILLLPQNDMWSPIVVQMASAAQHASFANFVSTISYNGLNLFNNFKDAT